jgi:hypothetical protein
VGVNVWVEEGELVGVLLGGKVGVSDGVEVSV